MAKRKQTDPDSMLVQHSHILEARQQVVDQGQTAALEALLGREPALASYLSQGMATIAGKMVLAGAPAEVAQGVHADVMLLVLSSLEASRSAQYDLWKDTIVGTRLEALQKPPEPEVPPKKPRRKKKEG